MTRLKDDAVDLIRELQSFNIKIIVSSGEVDIDLASKYRSLTANHIFMYPPTNAQLQEYVPPNDHQDAGSSIFILKSKPDFKSKIQLEIICKTEYQSGEVRFLTKAVRVTLLLLCIIY